jgi:hypothetical protein
MNNRVKISIWLVLVCSVMLAWCLENNNTIPAIINSIGIALNGFNAVSLWDSKSK